MIHFEFKELDEIALFEDADSRILNWMSLTDGALWLKYGDSVIYEYSEWAIKAWNKSNPYNDYFIARFIEDFSAIFNMISVEVPEELFPYTANLLAYREYTEQYLEDEGVSIQSKPNFITYEEFCILNNWISERSFHSSHLIHGPNLSFFRCGSVLRVVWDVDGVLDNGAPVWRAKSGYFDMSYGEFVSHVKSFADSFFSELEKQIYLAREKKWENMYVDHQAIELEQAERKKDFYAMLEVLESKSLLTGQWMEIRSLLNKISSVHP